MRHSKPSTRPNRTPLKRYSAALRLVTELRQKRARGQKGKRAPIRKPGKRGVPPDVKPQVLYPPEVLPNLPPAPTIPYIA